MTCDCAWMHYALCPIGYWGGKKKQKGLGWLGKAKTTSAFAGAMEVRKECGRSLSECNR